MFGFVVLPITFLGGTYYQWTKLSPVKIGSIPVVAGARADQPVDLRQRRATGGCHQTRRTCTSTSCTRRCSVFCAVFLTLGIRGFKRRVLA